MLNEKETNEAEEESEGIVNKQTFEEIFYLEIQGDRNVEEKNDLRISQPKYSQLLRDLDFSQTRMVKRKIWGYIFMVFI